MDAKKSNGLFIVLVLGLGVIAVSIAIRQTLEIRGHANLFNNVNSASQLGELVNADGTMGPTTWEGNYSNLLAQSLLGTLDMRVTDPVQGNRPQETMPTQAQDQKLDTTPGPGQTSNDKQPNSVSLSSLVVTFKKVEVHMDYLGTLGSNVTAIPTPNVSQTVTPKVTLHPSFFPMPALKITPIPSAKKPFSNKPVDHWEVIEMPQLVTVDLVQLAKTHDYSQLGLTRLAAGQYSETRLYIDSVTATLSDGTKITPVIPGHANIVRIVERFKVVAGQTTTISVDFDAQNSVIKTGSIYLFNPVVAHFNQANQQ